jgi:hypothetical protein
MKLAALSFLVLLLAAHVAGDTARLLGQPLSQFRDGEEALLGYGLFALLVLVGGLYAVALARSDRVAESAITGFAVLLLLLIAATPSLGVFHHLFSLGLLLVLFGYFTILLLRAGSPLLLAHLAMPLGIAWFTEMHSYGLWQKSFIVYIVLAATVHHHLLGRPAPPQPAQRRAGALPSRRRTVYALAVGREWARGA